MGKAKGPILVLVIIVLIAVAIFVIKPLLFDKRQRSTSDANSNAELVRIAGDGYLGYWFINSPEMKALAPRRGIEIDFTDDSGAYAERLEKFDDKEYDCIVLPINSYLEHGAKYGFPGVIVASISESQGADAIVGFSDVITSGKINELNNSSLKIVYTGQSPSSFLLDLTISDFDLDQLRNDKLWRKEVNSSEEVYDLAKKALKDRSVGDAFVMWEPEVSMAIEKLGMEYVWGSDNFSGYIVDVFVFRRDFVAKKPEVVERFLNTYFRVLDVYATDKEHMIKDMRKTTPMNEEAVKNMVDKIDWYDLEENCTQQFGISTSVGMSTNDGVVSTIIACSDVMSRSGNFDNKDLRDPYKIINSEILKGLSKSGVKSVGRNGQKLAVDFEKLGDKEWSKLKEIGTMRIEPITFQSGTNRLDEAGETTVDKVAQMLVTNYPNYRVAIKGHTGPGDAKANEELSLERAQVVLQRLVAVHGAPPEKLKAYGIGNTEPPKAKPGESPRALRLRMPRVEFVLLEGNQL